MSSKQVATGASPTRPAGDRTAGRSSDVNDSVTQPSSRHDGETQDVAAPNQDIASHPNHQRDAQLMVAMSETSTAHSDLIKPFLNAALGDGRDAVSQYSTMNDPEHKTAASVGLLLKTNDLPPSSTHHVATFTETPTLHETPVQTARLAFTAPIPIAATSSTLRTNLSTNSITSSHSPASTSSMLASPYLSAIADITPLPSPLWSSDFNASAWHKNRHGNTSTARPVSADDATQRGAARSSNISSSTPGTSPRRKKQYASLVPSVAAFVAPNNTATGQESSSTVEPRQGRNRSISEFVPESLHNVRQRMVTLGPGDQPAVQYSMHREAHLAGRRGLASRKSDPSTMLPSPPPSNTSVAESDDADEDAVMYHEGEQSDYLLIHCGIQNRVRRFRQIRQLGQGTFSKVMLATSQRLSGSSVPPSESDLDPNRLVAVKMVAHGPAGGADEERIEISLRREVEMLKSVSHPSLIHLKACEDQMTRTLLVLTYCPGGDLFELASDKRDLLTPKLIQRMFAELVSAVRYLHTHWIVHRDIKLENVLVNFPPDYLRRLEHPATHETPIITLSDLGLSRRLPEPPQPPLLTTRCGSEDYAAPEILLGQPYDGRLTDGWALGVLLYALIEGRLPFDAPPGKPDRSRNTHRIARCDWIWCRYGDDDGEWDHARGIALEGGRLSVEGLLKKVRMGRKPLEQIEQMQWVQEGIQVPGGLRTRSQDLDELE